MSSQLKVLFVGEGRHDIGPSDFANQYRPARGVVPTLVRKIVTEVSDDSVAIAWRDITAFRKAEKGRLVDVAHKRLARKVKQAVEMARRIGCQATICVHDTDRFDDRDQGLLAGRDLVTVDDGHRVVVGLAVRVVETWTLGAPQAIAQVLGQERKLVEDEIGVALSKIESLSNDSSREENQPKVILERVANMGHRKADVEFREEVAEATDVAELERNCPKGFGPFARELREAFGTTPIGDA